jgi:hypothetical protein
LSLNFLHASRITHYASRFTLHVLALISLPLVAAELNLSKLPPASTNTVSFEKDIKPIFEQTCLRCHGPERPKSHFRLDNRESALKGGDNGVDIIPGDSANSPLVHYVARLVPDMEMPPEGKGQPLTADQIGILRKWIDDGAQWGTTNPPVQFSGLFAPQMSWLSVSGDESKFREIEGVKRGFGGGVERFEARTQIEPDKILTIEGRALVNDNDYQVKLELRKTDFGFVRGGFEEWRRYYDDSGGYYQPFSPPQFSLGRDLHLDIGRAWADFGLTLPNWPQIVLGYEYQFKQGDKSTLEWGNVSGKNIYPAWESIDEQVNILKLDVSHDLYGFHVENNARVEFYDLNSSHNDAATFSTGPVPDSTVFSKENAQHVQGMNTLHFERQLTDWWLASGGYLYSQLDGSASLNQVTLDTAGLPTAGSFWSADTSTLNRESHIFSLASLLTPTTWFSASAGVQGEWTHQNGFGSVHLDEGDPNIPNAFGVYPAIVQSDLDEQKWSETASVRFTRIPWTVLFGEARLDQDQIGQYEQDAPTAGTPPDPATTFLRNTDYFNDRRQWRAGFDTSPYRWMSFSGHYRSRISDSDYDNSKIALDPTGYSAFIRSRTIDTDEILGKLVLRPLTWLKTTMTYQLVKTRYDTTTDPVPGGTKDSGLQAGDSDAHIYGINATLTPFQRLYFSGAFTYTDSSISTAQNGDPSIVPYRGHIYTFTGSSSYALNPKTNLRAAYSFSQSDYSQNNFASGLPLGLEYTRNALTVAISRRLSQTLTANLRYAFFQYSEPSSGGLNNYTAHGIAATLVYKWK